MAEILEALVNPSNEKVRELKSPIIGRGTFRVQSGQVIVAGQILLDLLRLNKHYLIQVPENISGTVLACKDNDRIVNLAYGEVFLRITSSLLKAKEHDSAKVFANNDPGVMTIDAPMDGLFYLSPSPESSPYVNIGDEIIPGQVLGLIEVMKCFYPVKYQGNKTSKIVGVSIKNGTPVTSGTEIFKISN